MEDLIAAQEIDFLRKQARKEADANFMMAQEILAEERMLDRKEWLDDLRKQRSEECNVSR